jgi:hypothetical protein
MYFVETKHWNKVSSSLIHNLLDYVYVRLYIVSKHMYPYTKSYYNLQLSKHK